MISSEDTAKRSLPECFGFYSVLTDPIKGYDYLTSLLVDNGMPVVQLRMKGVSDEIIIKTALRMRKITDGTGTRLIINDSPRIAVEVAADGVHIGQSDISYEDARKIVGDDMLIGISTHNPQQTRAACLLQPDYIGIGPVFTTPTKKIPDPPIGLSGMKEMLALSTVPAVCIGGIDLDNLPRVLEYGAKNFCMVRQFTQSENPAAVLREIAQSRFRT
ncbi:MAG: thiamine phosphate synthase [Chitinispirillales bacterium]|jgi:thiamine-phosphate pyrophosphorylase|nr:thiamine phosphate synthase [Chitinispirillales bacterium]